MAEYMIETATGLPSADLFATFRQAFADYAAPPGDMPLGRFETMLRQRGYTAGLSAVAIAGDGIAGFWLTGTDGARADRGAYVIAMGVVPASRQHRPARALPAHPIGGYHRQCARTRLVRPAGLPEAPCSQLLYAACARTARSQKRCRDRAPLLNRP